MDYSRAFRANIKGTTVPNPDSFGGKGKRSKSRAIRVCRTGEERGRAEGGEEGRRGAHNKLGSMGEIKREPSPSMLQEESGGCMRGILEVKHSKK